MRWKSQGRSQNTGLDLSRPWAKSPLKIWLWPPGDPVRLLFFLELTPSKWKQISKQGITECENETWGGIPASVCSYYLLSPALFSQSFCWCIPKIWSRVRSLTLGRTFSFSKLHQLLEVIDYESRYFICLWRVGELLPVTILRKYWLQGIS